MNEVHVEHRDGTYCRYIGFKKNGISVKEGDKIIPHSEIGILDQHNLEGHVELRLMVYYFDPEKLNKVNPSSGKSSECSFIILQFHTSSGNLSLISGKNYEVSISAELITREMNKREKKKYFATH